MPNKLPPNPANHYYADHIQLLLDSYERLLQNPLLSSESNIPLAEQVFNGKFALLSHNTDPDPLFNYANRTAQSLFEMAWHEMIGMPSRLSAEAMLRKDRDRLLSEVAAKGFISNYAGVRIAKSGKRFMIENAVVWNVYDRQQQFYGQAAYFREWYFLP